MSSGFKKWREDISTSSSQRHLEQYKFLLKPDAKKIKVIYKTLTQQCLSSTKTLLTQLHQLAFHSNVRLCQKSS